MATFLEIAETVLRQANQPLSAREIVEHARRENFFSDHLIGKTPAQTIKAKISVDIRRHGTSSRFVRTAPGRYFLRSLAEGEPYEARPMRRRPAEEEVLVISNEDLDDIGRFQGITLDWRPFLSSVGRQIQVIDRMEAEQDDRWKQLITYIMVTSGARVLSFKRGMFNRAEDHLRGAHCIGFGGHVMATDPNLFSNDEAGIYESAARELREELVVPSRDRELLAETEGLSVVGILNDDSSPAGRRHLAVVMRYEVADGDDWVAPQRGEKSITQLRWIEPGKSPLEIHDYEYWSQLCLRTFFSSVVDARATFKVRRRRPFVPPHVLCLLGPIGSGKTEAAQRLQDAYDYRELNSGRTVAALLEIPPVPFTPRADFQRHAHAFVTSPDGPSRLADVLWNASLNLEHDRVLIDGIRHRRTLEELAKRAAGSRRLGRLFIYTPPDLAFTLYRKREQLVEVDEFFALRQSPVEVETSAFLELADAVIYNWLGSSYGDAIDALMGDLRIDRR